MTLSVTIDIHVGDALPILRGLSSNTVDVVVTSPPYYFVRDYNHPQQIGLEPDPFAFVETLVEVFREVRRVLKPTGTCWLNIGDNYCTHRAIRSDGKRTVANGGTPRSWAESTKAGLTISGRQFGDFALKEKDLFLVPHLLAAALRADGWYLRATIHWIKSVIVPERQRDAPCDAVEYVFLLTKAPRDYVYNNEVLREVGTGAGRAHRNVWEIGPSRFRSEHCATMPEDLAARCILTGSHVGGLVLDPFGGAGTSAAVAATYGRHCTLIELNPVYAQIAADRAKDVNRLADVRMGLVPLCDDIDGLQNLV